jgi:hypothetical protein
VLSLAYPGAPLYGCMFERAPQPPYSDEELGQPQMNGRSPKLAPRRRDWRRIHHSPLFWIGMMLFLAAMAIYVLSVDLSWRPHGH